MDKVTTVRRQINREKWLAAINSCRSSGLSVTQWCKENGICEQTYYKNLKKFREEALVNQELSVIPENETSAELVTHQFAPIKVLPEQTKPSGITISIGQIRIDISDGTSADTIKHTLQAVKKLC